MARTQGRYVGIGVACCQEKGVFSATEFWMLNRAPGFALTSSPESASVKIDATGKAVISLHAPCWGNSPETVAAMVLAEQLTMDPADIRVTYSDTDHGLPGTGPGGSRYTVMVTGAVAGAARILKEKLKRVASHMLEAGSHDLEFRNGKVGVKLSITHNFGPSDGSQFQIRQTGQSSPHHHIAWRRIPCPIQIAA